MVTDRAPFTAVKILQSAIMAFISTNQSHSYTYTIAHRLHHHHHYHRHRHIWRSYALLLMFIYFSPRDLRAPSADSRETLPHDRKWLQFYTYGKSNSEKRRLWCCHHNTATVRSWASDSPKLAARPTVLHSPSPLITTEPERRVLPLHHKSQTTREEEREMGGEKDRLLT